MYLSAIQPGNLVETRFLSFAQCIEALHRETIGSQLLKDDEFVGALAALQNAVPKELPREAKETIKKRLEYLNDPAFARRIKEMCRMLPNYETIFPDYKGKARSVADHRNQLVHVLPGQKPLTDVVEEMSSLSMFLRGLIELSLLRLIHFEPDCLVEIVKRNRRYRH